ncbi:MAG: hypothetical protein ACRBEQ_11525 [Hyphomonas sp.]
MRKQFARTIPLAALMTFIPALSPISAAETINTDAIFACTTLADDAERLACFDQNVSKFKAAEDAGDVQTFTKEDVARERKRNFGFAVPSFNFGKDVNEDDGLEKLVVNVVSIDQDPYKKVTITLENGQIWKQTDSRRISTRNVETAEIRKAALGSFKIKLDGGSAFKAKRVK